MESKQALPEQEQTLLTSIERMGAVSPSRLAAQMQIAPPEMWDMLKHLAELSWVIIRDDPVSADGKLVIATGTNMAAQSKVQ